MIFMGTKARKELRKAILDWLFENENAWNRVNACVEQFRMYIYDGRGQFLIGGKEVLGFIREADMLMYA